MLTLRQILTAHAPLLLIDSASSQIQVGLWRGEGLVSWQNSPEEAGVGLFRAIELLHVDFREIGAFVFCSGPGSVLGIRTAAMALRTWNALDRPRPLFAYSSLSLVSAALGEKDTTIIADARRELWHRYQLNGEISRVPVTQLSGKLVTPEGFRHWSQPPAGLTQTSYLLTDLWPRAIDSPLLREVNSPDAFSYDEPSYVTWTPQIHRAPKA